MREKFHVVCSQAKKDFVNIERIHDFAKKNKIQQKQKSFCSRNKKRERKTAKSEKEKRIGWIE